MTSMKTLPPGFDPGFKFLTDETGVETGEVEFYASVFGNVDLVGDIVMPGAFAESLKTWRASGDPIPVVFSHDWSNAHAILGSADPNKCVEDDRGLLIRAKLDIFENPYAKLVYSQMKRRIVKEASFAFDVVTEGKVSSGKDRGANMLKVLNILEVGPCLKGANPLAGDPVMKALGIGPDAVLEGTAEERQATLGVAVEAMFGGKDALTFIEGTFLDKDEVIAAVLKTDAAEATHYAITYTIGPDGTAALGPARKVELEPVIEEGKSAEPGDHSSGSSDGTKTFAWTDADGNGHIPIDTEGQVRAAINLASNGWTFRGNHMSPAPAEDERPGVIRRIVDAAHKFNIETDLEAPKADVAEATSETGAGDGNVQTTGQYGGVVEPDYGDERKAAEVKVGARHSAHDLASLQAAHDALVTAGAKCPDSEAEPAAAQAEFKEPEANTDDGDPADLYLKRAEFFQEIGDLEGELKMLDLAREARKADTDLPKVEAKSGNDAGEEGDPADDEKAAEDCATCDGTGKVDGKECPDCGGSGKTAAETKDLDPGDGDDVDTDGDHSAPADAADAAEPFGAQKSASTDTTDEGETKTEEPDGAKAEESAGLDVESVKADLTSIEAFLRSVS